MTLCSTALARGDLARAEREAKAALGNAEDRVRAPVILARVANERGDHEAALKSADEAALLSRTREPLAGLHFLRGDLLARLGRDGEAEEAFREEIRLFPEDPQPYANLILLYVSDGRLQEATRVIHDLEKAAPTPPAYAAISEALRVVGDDRGARFWALRGLQRFPKDETLRRLAG